MDKKMDKGKSTPIYKQIRAAIDRSETPVTPPKSGAEEHFIGSLINSVGVAHILHLNTVNYETHKWLDKYYKELPELIDALAEATIGLKGTTIPVVSESFECPNTMLGTMIARANEAHKGLEPTLTNPLESIMTFLAKMQYLSRLQ